MNVTNHLFWIVAAVALGQEPAAPGFFPDDPAVRLAFMKKSIEIFSMRPAEGPVTPYRLQPDPVLRFTNPVGGSKDGAIFLWLDDGGRPRVVNQVFRRAEGDWWQEFCSLSTEPLIASSDLVRSWAPSTAGITFAAVPGAPKPGATAEQRLVQMRALARDFSADDFFKNKTWSALRLLPKPLARYGKAGSDVIDGAVFAFVIATDPEVLLVMEARTGTGTDSPSWQFAFAPMTSFAVKASYKGRSVWELPTRFGVAKNRDATFHMRPLPPPE